MGLRHSQGVCPGAAPSTRRPTGIPPKRGRPVVVWNAGEPAARNERQVNATGHPPDGAPRRLHRTRTARCSNRACRRHHTHFRPGRDIAETGKCPSRPPKRSSGCPPPTRRRNRNVFRPRPKALSGTSPPDSHSRQSGCTVTAPPPHQDASGGGPICRSSSRAPHSEEQRAHPPRNRHPRASLPRATVLPATEVLGSPLPHPGHRSARRARKALLGRGREERLASPAPVRRPTRRATERPEGPWVIRATRRSRSRRPGRRLRCRLRRHGTVRPARCTVPRSFDTPRSASRALGEHSLCPLPCPHTRLRGDIWQAGGRPRGIAKP